MQQRDGDPAYLICRAALPQESASHIYYFLVSCEKNLQYGVSVSQIRICDLNLKQTHKLQYSALRMFLVSPEEFHFCGLRVFRIAPQKFFISPEKFHFCGL